MAFPSQLSGKIQSLASKVLQKAGAFFAGLFDRLRAIADSVPREKRRLAVIGVIAAFALVLLVFTLVLPGSGGRPSGGRMSEGQGPSGTASALSAQSVIPPDELFLPEEPDFVPGVLSEERRAAWTVDDAAPWWRDPLKNGEQIWRDQIERTVDEIMEGVP